MSMLAPYRTLVLITMRNSSWRDYNGTGTFTIRTGPAARSLKLSPARLRQHLQWLETNRLICDLQLSYGKATYNLPLQGLELTVPAADEGVLPSAGSGIDLDDVFMERLYNGC